MKTFFRTRVLHFVAFLVILSACKKDEKTKLTNTDVVVKYVITTSAPIALTRNNEPTDNWIAFSGNSGIGENVDRNLSGSQWVKEIKLDKVASGRELGYTAQIYVKGQNSVVTGKIFVNGELRAESTVHASAYVYEVSTSELKLLCYLP
jgi:hypothetical protein